MTRAVSEIQTEEEFDAAVALWRALWGAAWDDAPGGPDREQFEALAARIADYEDRHHPVRPPTSEEASAFRRDQESARDDGEPS